MSVPSQFTALLPCRHLDCDTNRTFKLQRALLKGFNNANIIEKNKTSGKTTFNHFVFTHTLTPKLVTYSYF